MTCYDSYSKLTGVDGIFALLYMTSRLPLHCSCSQMRQSSACADDPDRSAQMIRLTWRCFFWDFLQVLKGERSKTFNWMFSNPCAARSFISGFVISYHSLCVIIITGFVLFREWCMVNTVCIEIDDLVPTPAHCKQHIEWLHPARSKSDCKDAAFDGLSRVERVDPAWIPTIPYQASRKLKQYFGEFATSDVRELKTNSGERQVRRRSGWMCLCVRIQQVQAAVLML